MPRKKPSNVSKALQPLAQASDRLQLLENSGLSKARRAALLAKSVALLEELLDNPMIDPFARIAAAKAVIRDIAAVAPSKSTGEQRAPQTPVTIVLPDYIGRAPKVPAPRPVGASSTSQPQVHVAAE
jgi:hypothetical protein